jgi:hypothetical protein
MNKLLGDILKANIWFWSKITDTIKRKYQPIVHHHENVVKSAQHHWLAPGSLPHDVLDIILNHSLTVPKKCNLVPFINYTLELFQIEVSHLYNLVIMEFTIILWIPNANANLLDLFEFLPLSIHLNFSANASITPDVGQANLLTIRHTKSFQTISNSDLHSCFHLGDTFFCKGRKVMETSLKRGTLTCKCWSYPDYKQIPSSWGQGEDFWVGWKHLGCLFNRDNHHKSGVPCQKHDQVMPDQVRRCHLNWSTMLHPDHG